MFNRMELRPIEKRIAKFASDSDQLSGIGLTATIVAFLLLIELFVNIGWLIDYSLVSLALPGSLSIVILLSFKLTNPKHARLLTISFLTALITCGTLAISTLDFSSDGQSYQQEAILGLASGWNPFRASVYPGAYSIWISHYSAGPWMLAAPFYKLTGNIEVGKCISYLLMACVGLTAHELAKILGTPRLIRVSFAVLLALNPIACCQLQTYFIDGQVGSLLSLTALLIALLGVRPTLAVKIALFGAIALAINTKLSSLPMELVLVAASMMMLLLFRRKKEALHLTLPVAFGISIGAFIAFHPYATNWINNGNPFFPLAGEGKVDILTEHVSADFLAENRFIKLGTSLISQSEWRHVGEVSGDIAQFRPKLPFLVYPSEIIAFYKSTGMCVGGFGPWTSAILLLSILFWTNLLFRKWKPSTSDKLLFSILTGLMASVLVMPECWWARYAPQGWTLLMLVLFLPFLTTDPTRSKIGRFAIAASILNVAMVILPAIANRFVSEMDWKAQAASILSIREPIKLKVSVVDRSALIRLENMGIIYVNDSSQTCEGISDFLIGSNTKICVPRVEPNQYLRGSPWVAKTLGRKL